MNNLKELIEDINSRPPETPEQVINNVIEIMRLYSMDIKSMDINNMFMITEDGKFSHVPIPSHLLHGDMGEMMIKSYIKNAKDKNYIPNSLIEINFAHGILAKFHKSEEDKFNKLSDEIKKDMETSKTAEEFINKRDDFQDYFVVNIFKQNKAELKIYDIITSVDKFGKTLIGEPFIINPKPTVEEEVNYDGKQFIDYFKE